MLFVEYTENDTKKAINVALCHTIEIHTHQTSLRGDFSIKLEHLKGSTCINFKTEEHLNKAFESLMDAIQNSQIRYWKVPNFDEAQV